MEHEHEVDGLEIEIMHLMLDLHRNQPDKFLDFCRWFQVNPYTFSQFLEQDLKSRQH